MTWDEDDRDKALAWQASEDDRCPGCGSRWSESTDHQHRTEWVAEKVTCHACHTRQALSEDAGAGTYVMVRRRGDGG